MKLAIDIVKRGGKRPSENFERNKLRDSIIAACISAGAPDGQAALTADTVCDAVAKWLENRHEVTSQDIRIVAARNLLKFHADAAYLYEQHRITI